MAHNRLYGLLYVAFTDLYDIGTFEKAPFRCSETIPFICCLLVRVFLQGGFHQPSYIYDLFDLPCSEKSLGNYFSTDSLRILYGHEAISKPDPRVRLGEGHRAWTRGL